mmetsp:Transcript_11463/g.18117  ORF Transcript_11463/g.18117 Transcript_11463/m.18117 type:complete len:156 (-) Transcript_11463:196-663(-)
MAGYFHFTYGLLKEAVEGPMNAAVLELSFQFLILQGVAYTLVGVLFIVLPNTIAENVLMFKVEGTGDGILRAAGAMLTIIGYFYVQGGRTGDRFFIASTTFDRLTIVPLLVLILGLLGTPVGLCVTFAILDPLLALSTAFVRYLEVPGPAGARVR